MSDMAAFHASAAFIRERYPHALQVAAILGSGLGDLADTMLPNALKIPFSEIPFFPASTVEGHCGTLCLGEIRPGVHGAFLQGRVHYYEGHAMAQVVYPLRVLRMLGAETLIITNSAGGVNTAFQPGDVMLIADHLNLMGTNPLIGENMPAFGPRFPDMSNAYTASLQTLAKDTAQTLGIPLQSGVYCALSGPSYETPAEIRMLRTLGADAVGMSTVPEVITAAHMGMQVLGLSCITNAAAGVIVGHRLSHAEVLQAAQEAKAKFSALIQGILASLPVSPTNAAAPHV